VGRQLPAGTVTFLFTDVEGSTRLLHALGPEAYADALAEHRRVVREAFARHGGVEVDTQGDAFFVAFPTAPGALAAAAQAREALAAGPIRVRMGLHTGSPLLGEEGYIGPDVHKGARIAAAGHGGQILVSEATAQLVDGAGLRDLGLHRLKDLTAPERIYQLGAQEHPPLKTLHQTNLPVPATPFLGREAELAELVALLARDEVRLVTLTGPGGTGKTRLALQAAADAAEAYPGGIWWVPLAPLRDPALVLDSAARAVGASGDLAEHIGDRRLLLLLDNFEHLVSAADDLAPIMAACPRLTVLVTSREPLHLAGEHEYAVDPLAPSEAVELFLTRAVAAKRDFTADGEVARICERLDHLPLAIELAAARVKVLSPHALLARLEQRLPLLAGGARDLPERQRTLRATIEWSHELLSPDEQRLFGRLAAFRGGWTLEAAEAVAAADLDTLQSLVDKSLVRVRDTGRFWMLETIREFAVERLDASGEADEIRGRHAEYFLAMAEELQPRAMADDHEALDRLEADHDNLRAAMDRFDAQRDADRLQRLAGSLWRFWYLRSHFVEGKRRLSAALATAAGDTPALARVLHGSSVMAINLGDPDAAYRHAEQALAVEERLGNRWGMAYATMMMGNSLAEGRRESRDLRAARDRLEASARLFDEIGDRQFGLIAHYNTGWVREDLGDREGARQVHEAALATAREIGNAGIEADALAQLGMHARDDGRLDEAVHLLRESLTINARHGMTFHVAMQLGRLASALVRRGEADLAARLVGASRAAMENLGAEYAWWQGERDDETLTLARSTIGDEAVSRAEEEGRRLGTDAAVALALAADDPRA